MQAREHEVRAHMQATLRSDAFRLLERLSGPDLEISCMQADEVLVSALVTSLLFAGCDFQLVSSLSLAYG